MRLLRILVGVSGKTVVVGKPNDGLESAEPALGRPTSLFEPATGWADMTQTAELTTGDTDSATDWNLGSHQPGNTVVVGAPASSDLEISGRRRLRVCEPPTGGRT